MTIYYHGGRFPQHGVLRPQPVRRDGHPGDGYVYVTTERDLAATYASTLPGGVVMEVQPLGAVERDPESMLGTSFRCRSARVVRWWRLSKWEREARSRMVAIARRTEEPA